MNTLAKKRRINCKHCSEFFYSIDDYASHMEKNHAEMIPKDMKVRQYIYFLNTGKTHGDCVVCKSPTKWNDATNKYHRFCENPKCKEIYREEFKRRMIGKYGKITLLDDPEQQKLMLARRRISGTYRWSDMKHESTYTGTYELEFLRFLDEVMNFNPEDVMTPSPHTYYYYYDGKRRFYIPDLFIPSLNLEIEIKDGGDNPNNHPKIQNVDKEKERLKDNLMKSRGIPFNYVKIVNKDHKRFLEFLEEAKVRTLNNDDTKIIMI